MQTVSLFWEVAGKVLLCLFNILSAKKFFTSVFFCLTSRFANSSNASAFKQKFDECVREATSKEAAK